MAKDAATTQAVSWQQPKWSFRRVTQLPQQCAHQRVESEGDAALSCNHNDFNILKLVEALHNWVVLPPTRKTRINMKPANSLRPLDPPNRNLKSLALIAAEDPWSCTSGCRANLPWLQISTLVAPLPGQIYSPGVHLLSRLDVL